MDEKRLKELEAQISDLHEAIHELIRWVKRQSLEIQGLEETIRRIQEG